MIPFPFVSESNSNFDLKLFFVQWMRNYKAAGKTGKQFSTATISIIFKIFMNNTSHDLVGDREDYP